MMLNHFQTGQLSKYIAMTGCNFIPDVMYITVLDVHVKIHNTYTKILIVNIPFLDLDFLFDNFTVRS